MTSPARRLSVLSLLLVLAVSLGTLSSVSPASASGFTPQPGVTTNNPLGNRDQRRAIVRKLIRTIDSTPRRSQIRVASWNIRSDAIVDALIRAHKRHVMVRVVMDRGNANQENPNSGVDRLERVLAHYGNQNRPPEMRSHLRKCASSCRGERGIAHSKFFLFERAGRAHDVVMNGSFNATDLASGSQWNDLYTVRGRHGIYLEFTRVFSQMSRDRPVAQGFRARNFAGLTTMAFPYTGQHTNGDPALRELDRVRCSGARNTADGRTGIRIAQTSWYGTRGKRIALRVREMQNRGCHIRIVYAVMGNEVLRILRNGGTRPVPMRQIVQDFDGDGVYDRYLHMKVLTVRGHYGGSRRAWVTVNGSANWSPAVLASDEAVLRLNRPGVLRHYSSWIDFLFENPPSRPRTALSARTSTPVLPGTVVPDPYAEIQPD